MCLGVRKVPCTGPEPWAQPPVREVPAVLNHTWKLFWRCIFWLVDYCAWMLLLCELGRVLLQCLGFCKPRLKQEAGSSPGQSSPLRRMTDWSEVLLKKSLPFGAQAGVTSSSWMGPFLAKWLPTGLREQGIECAQYTVPPLQTWAYPLSIYSCDSSF